MLMKFMRLSRRRVFRLWVGGVLSMLVVCCLLGVTLLILNLTRPDVPPALPEPTPPDSAASSGEEADDTASVYAAHPRVLGQTADAGQGYLDRLIFVGESTTAHLRSRGVLSGGTKTQQVWSNRENTMTLDLNILQKTICYPATGEDMTIAQATALSKPDFLVLSFGVNGLNTFEKNRELYQIAYGRLIDAIHQASPSTVVLLQTVYPVASNQQTFAQGAQATNRAIDQLNESLLVIAQKHDAYVVDTASVLKDERGMLDAEYQNGDGLHLQRVAYERILTYLRTHAYGG